MNNKLNRDDYGLTDDMVEIIKLIPLEMTQAEISERTGVNVHTVRSNIALMYELFDVESNVGLTRVSLSLGYFVERRTWSRI